MSTLWFTAPGFLEAQLTADTKSALLILSLAVTSAVLLLSITIGRVKSNRADFQFERAHGCGSPRPLQYKWPFALDLVIDAFRIIAEKQALQWFVQIFDRTGPTFEQNVLGVKGVDTIEPDNLEVILSSKFSAYGLGARSPTFAPLLGDGIFTQEAAPWKHSRDMLRPLFSLNRANIFTQVEEHTEYLVDCIPTGEFVDLQTLFFRFTFDTTTFLLFGKSMNSLQATINRDEIFFSVADDWEILYWLIGGKEFRRQCSIVHEFIDEAVQGALSAEYQKDKAEDVHSFLDALIQQTRDPKVLRDQLLNVMLAGRDTTACCLTWTFRLLAQHPEVLAKLRQEIDSIVGLGAASRLPDRNDLKRMKYLNLVFKEVLRLYPSVPINSRTALEATTIPLGGGPDGTKPVMIRKGEAVGYSVYVMHRLKKLYGEDANAFRPERWDPDVDNAVDLKNIGWGYLPFNGGPRICLGQEFALLEAGFVVVRILQKFRSFELGPKDKDIAAGTENQEVTLVVASTNGCRVKALE
ncbi:MAG: hypothetical protein Q9168_005617 [Polycauliona sp. 1 TL-2023]